MRDSNIQSIPLSSPFTFLQLIYWLTWMCIQCTSCIIQCHFTSLWIERYNKIKINTFICCIRFSILCMTIARLLKLYVCGKKNPNLTSPCSIGPLFYIGANSHEKHTCVCSKSLCVKVLIEMFVKFSHEWGVSLISNTTPIYVMRMSENFEV